MFLLRPVNAGKLENPPCGAGEVHAISELGFNSYRGATGSRVAAGESGNVASDDDVCGRGVL